MLAKAVLPLAVLFILSACGGSTRRTGTLVSGLGASFRVPTGWQIARTDRSVAARQGGQLVEVALFRLARSYDPAKFGLLKRSTDTAAAQLARAAHTTVSASETLTIGGVQARAYRYGRRRIGFVVQGTSEYQLYCAQVGDACDLLFRSFTLD